MDPLMIIGVLCILVPIVGVLLGFMPIYIGIYYALYAVYAPKQGTDMLHPLEGRFWEISTMLHQYRLLIDHHGFTQALLLPPSLGAAVALILLYSFYRYVRGQFTVDSL